MEEVFASLKIPIRLSMAIFIMVSLKDRDNSIFQQAITMLDSSDLIKSRVEARIIGPENNSTLMKENSRQAKGMARELSGGPMEVGTKANSGKESNAVTEYSLEKEAIKSMKECGRTVCSMEKELNSLITDKDTKATSKKISFMATESFTKTIQSFMEFGRTMSYQSLTWLSRFLVKSDYELIYYLYSI